MYYYKISNTKIQQFPYVTVALTHGQTEWDGVIKRKEMFTDHYKLAVELYDDGNWGDIQLDLGHDDTEKYTAIATVLCRQMGLISE